MAMFRKILFWSHLSTAVLAGLFIFFMSATGVVIGYQHPILNLVAKTTTITVPEGIAPMTADEIAAIAQTQAKGTGAITLRYVNRANAPVTMIQNRKDQAYIDPFSGQNINSSKPQFAAFFSKVIALHRWLAMEGKSRKIARAITGAANLIFLFIIISGLYLWLPKIWKWAAFKRNLLFQQRPPTAKARDYNWHHVLGIWALIPLFFIITTGAIMSYPWANAMLYAAYGEKPPARRGSRQGGDHNEVSQPQNLATLDAAFNAAKLSDKNWTRIDLIIPAPANAPSMRMIVNNGAGLLPRQRTTHTYDRVSARITNTLTNADVGKARRARVIARYLHTGEQFGIIGSTIAVLASLAACFLAYTGLALAYRRLIMPLLRKR